jgi:uncharacterized protein (DUF2147 family)
MKHHAITAALGLLTVAFAAPAFPSQAAALDPSGYWLKDDGTAKMEVKKCGKGGLCCKIVWLQESNDSRGKPLHDARNEDASMRDRPIIGLPLFSNLSPTEPNTWVGSVYNPEEGHYYSDVKVTVLSRQQLVLRGCKAWLLCGEKMWTRTTAPVKPPVAEPEQQEASAPGAPETQGPIEAAAEPQVITAPSALGPKEPAVEAAAQQPEVKAPAAPAPQAPRVEATAERAVPPPMPTPKPGVGASVPVKQVEASAADEAIATESLPGARGAASPQVLKPELPAPSQDAAAGYGFMLTTATPESAPPFSSERVSTMFVITHPLNTATASNAPVSDVAAAAQEPEAGAAPIPLPNQKPKATPKPTIAADAGSAPTVAPKPKPKPVKKEAEDLPWLQHP